MAYFDSPKNRALWDKELANLRKLKQERSNGVKPETSGTAIDTDRVVEKSPIAVRSMAKERTSYKQLLLEEAASVKTARKHMTQKVAKKEKNLDLDLGAHL